MKLKNKLIILTFIIIFITTNKSYSLQTKNKVNSSLNNLFYIEEKTIEENNDFFESNIKYPFLNIDKEIVLKENYDSKFLENINEDIFNYIKEFEDEILSISNEYKVDCKKRSNNMLKYSFEAYSEYKTTYNKNNILSIPILTNSFTGEAHNNIYLKSFNYDLERKKELKIKDIFKDNIDYKKIIEDFVNKEIKKSQANYFLEKDFILTDEQEFYIEEDGITIYFQAYDIAPYYMGIVQFKILFNHIPYIFNENLTY